ncbi:N-acetylneuraminate 7-O(or 9-O)-acetyltransferase [Olea europaea subsp. europaea]|uniref:N-acetylneuraminate 7-O(Or 9-O)-acetyltransferase n=1 Tax=Olea europaea subsp. europaea TaxID=158383 RepID=A0A8S0SD66_OLEEU|nr:N-acetylneuraminate 7-O(or 9-O)-acetyltransferase [Olea europaea subsp. europaea]
MFGAVQFGLLAAGIVLFVPMGMAGWHLSRNKMLFFSCALFITLAVGVHLAPFFPSISSFLYKPSSISDSSLPTGTTSSSMIRDSCIFSLHSVVMYKSNYSVCVDDAIDSNSASGCKKMYWKWTQPGSVAECGFQKLKKPDVSVLLNGSWVVVAGDSQARLMVASLLELVMGPEGMKKIRGDLFKRHSDYSITVDEIGMKLDFTWAPYVRNLTNLMLKFRENKDYPDIILIGAGLWDMLHLNNATEYGISLSALKDSVLALLPVFRNTDSIEREASELAWIRSPHLFWLGMPALISSMLNTVEKREKMKDVMCNAYDDEVSRTKLLWQSGGPLLKLDIRWLTDLCGPQCTVDGMHYDGIVYDAAVQIMLNALLLESNQKAP